MCSLLELTSIIKWAISNLVNDIFMQPNQNKSV